MDKWITFLDLCKRWSMNKHNLAHRFITGEMMAYDPDDFWCLYKARENYVRQSPEGESIYSRSVPPTVDEVATYIFDIDEVMRYEQERGIIPNVMSADFPAQNSIADPDVTLQSHNDKPLVTLQEWHEVNHLYDVIKKIGLQVPNAAERLRIAAKRELKQNKGDYRCIKQRHLDIKNLFAFHLGKERRDFIGNLLQIITSKRGQKKIGAQRLYSFGKRSSQNRD